MKHYYMINEESITNTFIGDDPNYVEIPEEILEEINNQVHGQTYKEIEFKNGGLQIVVKNNPHFVEQELYILRNQREVECFSIINRGKLWYDSLDENQTIELNTWYQAWLDVTETRVIPIRPEWLE